jgi:hypothetical protein
MDATAPTIATGWEARPVAAQPAAPATGGRWGIVLRSTGRWVAPGSEARCRALVAHLAEVDAILTRSAPPVAP